MRKLCLLLCAFFCFMAFAPAAMAGTKTEARNQASLYYKYQRANDFKSACKMLSRQALSDMQGVDGCVANFSTNGFETNHAWIKKAVVYKKGTRAYVILRVDSDHDWRLNFVLERGVFKLNSDA